MPAAVPQHTPAQTAIASAPQLIARAAATHGIDPRTLWGVYGTESGYGTNLGPSSAGALGPMQFMPATARGFHINPRDFDWSDDINGAAKYLKQLGADGNIDSDATAQALNKYSGGGGQSYIDSVRSKGKTYKAGKGNPITDAVSAVTDAVTAPFDAVKVAGGAFVDVVNAIFDPTTWLRIGKIVGGLFLIAIGFYAVMNKAGYAPKAIPIPV